MEAPPIINTSFPEGSSNFGKGWTVKGILYGGVDYAKAGYGGPDCLASINPIQRWVETVVVVTFFTTECLWAWNRLQVQLPTKLEARAHSPTVRRWLILVLAAVFGVEIGFKFCSRTALFLMNPCHILTMLQLYLLVSDGQDWVGCVLFRFMLYALTGPVLALLFPVLNTLKQPLEIEWYYVQHYSLLIIPLYLLSLGGAYTAEPLWDWSMALFSTGVLMLYHFVPLQLVGLITWVNVNNMVCPAISDPFKGRWWRIAAVCHQHLLVPLVGKFFVLFARFLASVSDSVPWVLGGEPAEVLGPIREPLPAPTTPIPASSMAVDQRSPIPPQELKHPIPPSLVQRRGTNSGSLS